MASNTTSGEMVNSKSQTITATDPGPASLSPQIALLTQYMAASFKSHTAGLEGGWARQGQTAPEWMLSSPGAKLAG
jgi:hypothetical protein